MDRFGIPKVATTKALLDLGRAKNSVFTVELTGNLANLLNSEPAWRAACAAAKVTYVYREGKTNIVHVRPIR